MAGGLQLFNTSGNMILDVTSEVGRYVTSGSVTLARTTGFADINVPGMVNDDSWFIFVDTSGDAISSFTVVKSTGSFRLSNTTTTTMAPATCTFSYWVVRR